MELLVTVGGIQNSIQFAKRLSNHSAIDTVINGIFDKLGVVLLNRTRTRFLSEKDPDGSSWVPSKAGIKRRASGGTGTLYDTGTLFRSIQWAKENPMTRLLGTDVPYASDHQFGTSRLPIRKFLGFSEEDQEIINTIVVNNLQQYLNS